MGEDYKKKYEIMKENGYTLAKRIDKAVEVIKLKIEGYKKILKSLTYANIKNKEYEIKELKYRIMEQEELLDILEGRDQFCQDYQKKQENIK